MKVFKIFVSLKPSGYMSPEYAMSGHFSVKSDVFSYGVIVLETITGKKNWGFYHPDHDYNLIGHVSKSFQRFTLLYLFSRFLLFDHSDIYNWQTLSDMEVVE